MALARFDWLPALEALADLQLSNSIELRPAPGVALLTALTRASLSGWPVVLEGRLPLSLTWLELRWRHALAGARALVSFLW